MIQTYKVNLAVRQCPTTINDDVVANTNNFVVSVIAAT